MTAINNIILTSGTLPEDYQETLYWTVTGKPRRVIAMNILGLVPLVISGLIFSWLAFSLGKLPSEGGISLNLSAIGLVLAGALLTLVLHELTHGLAMQMFGAKPKYGMMWQGMLYATSPGYAY